MKFHRVLLFTTIQMDITPVGDDIHILLTGGDNHRIGCTAFSVPRLSADPVETPTDSADGEAAGALTADDNSVLCDTTVIKSDEDADASFCAYVAENIAKQTGQRTLCTGGVYVNHPDEHQIDKLYENIDEMIQDWANFLID